MPRSEQSEQIFLFCYFIGTCIQLVLLFGVCVYMTVSEIMVAYGYELLPFVSFLIKNKSLMPWMLIIIQIVIIIASLCLTFFCQSNVEIVQLCPCPKDVHLPENAGQNAETGGKLSDEIDDKQK